MHTTQSGSQQPQGPDAFNPPAQFTAWGDKTATYENRLIVSTDSARLALAAPELRDGVEVYVSATGLVWVYVVSTWVPGPLATLANISSFGTGFAATAGNHVPRVRSVGNQVFLYGSVTASTGFAFTTILTVPAAFQPPTTGTRFVGSGVASNGVAFMLAMTAGVLSIPTGYAASSIPITSNVPLYASWWMD